MKHLRTVFLVGLVMFTASHALAYTPPVSPTYTGSDFDLLQAMADDSAIFFGWVLGLSVMIFGFFLGRKWMRRV